MKVAQTTNENQSRQEGITGSTLKMIAMASMLMDHVGLFLVNRILIQHGFYELANQAATDAFMRAYGGWY